MKTKEELFQLKKEYEALSIKLKELSEEELKEVVGGYEIPKKEGEYNFHIYTDQEPSFTAK